jgi:hypothetical protein
LTGGHRGRSLVLVLLLLSVLAVFGFWEIRHSFEKNLRTDLVRIVRQAYEGQAEIGSVHLNLLTGNVRFRNVRFRFPLGQSGEYRTLFDFPGVDGHLSLLSLLTRVYDFRELTFLAPSVTGVMRDDGSDNYRQFFEKWREGVQTPHGGGAVVRSFRIRKGRVSWGIVGKPPVVEMREISGRVTSNPLMNRFQVRFSSPGLELRKAGGGVVLDAVRFSGSIEKGSLRDFRLGLSMRPSWFRVQGNVTQIQNVPFLDVFFHGTVGLSGLEPLLGGRTGDYSGVLLADGYIHGPAAQWEGNLRVNGSRVRIASHSYRKVFLKARFSSVSLDVHPFSAVLAKGGKMSATLIASLSTPNPVARLTVRQTRIPPLFPGGEPLEMSVGRDIPLSPKTSVVEEWIELANRLMGVPVS